MVISQFVFERIGRTWISAMFVWITATVLFIMGKVDIGTWKEISFFAIGAGAIKSTVLGGIEKINKQKKGNQDGKSIESNS